jgi:hypothetical protein
MQKGCACYQEIDVHLGNLALIVTEYAHQFSLETFAKLAGRALFGASAQHGEIKELGWRIREVQEGAQCFSNPCVAADFWGGPAIRIFRSVKGIRCLNIFFKNPSKSWHESINHLFSPQERQCIWDHIGESDEPMSLEFNAACDCLLTNLNFWLYKEAHKLVCPYAQDSMPHHMPPPFARRMDI